jgi:hypothetical protein
MIGPMGRSAGRVRGTHPVAPGKGSRRRPAEDIQASLATTPLRSRPTPVPKRSARPWTWHRWRLEPLAQIAHAEHVREPDQRREPDVLPTVLDSLQVLDRDVKALGDLRLREPACSSQLAEAPTHADLARIQIEDAQAPTLRGRGVA